MSQNKTNDLIEIEVSCKKDLYIEVDRSPNATLKIPELGVEITPGPAKSEPINQVIDIITQIENVLNTYVEENNKKTKLLKKIERIKNGNKEIKVIIDDPTGKTTVGEKE